MKRRTRWGFLLLCTLLAATPAAVSAEVTFPPHSMLAGPPLAAFAKGSDEEPAEVELRAPTATIYVGEKEQQDLVLVRMEMSRNVVSYPARNVTIRILSTDTGWRLGIHGSLPAEVRIIPRVPFVVEGRNATLMADTVDSNYPRQRSTYETLGFHHHVTRPHLFLEAPSAFSYRGEGAFHFRGGTYSIDTDDNSTVIKLSEEDTPGLVKSYPERWLYVWANDAELRLVANHVEVGMLNATSDGVLLTPERGSVVLRTVAVPPPAPESSNRALPPFLAPVALALLAAGLVVPFALRRARTALDDPLECWEPEDCMRRAGVHVEAGNWERALAWTDRALSLAATSSSAHATRARLLERLERPADALLAYREAARLAPEAGEHEVAAARLALRTGGDEREALAALLRGLAASPGVVAGVEGDPAFERFREIPGFHDAVQEAWSRHIVELRDGDEGGAASA